MCLFLFSIFLFILLGSFKVETGLSLSVAPVSVRYIREKKTSDSCWGVSHTSENKLLCAVNGGIEIRSQGLQLEQKIDMPSELHSAQLIAGGKLVSKVCDFYNYSTYIGTETDPQQTLLHSVKYEGTPYLSHMSATDHRIADIDRVNKQLRIYSAAGDHQFNISLADMKSPRGVHLLPDDSAVLVTDLHGGELRKYPLTAAAKPVWRHGGIIGPSGVTTDESGLIYVCSLSREKMYLIPQNGE